MHDGAAGHDKRGVRVRKGGNGDPRDYPASRSAMNIKD